MAIYRAQITFSMDSLLPRDAIQMNPHFEVAQGVAFGGTEEQTLAQDLQAAMTAWSNNNKPVRVKLYDAQGTPPVYPVGDSANAVTAPPDSAGPREVALCLSYYAVRNIKRQRGRLYAPGNILGGGFGVRPSAGQREKVAALVPHFANLGGANVDWVIYSRLDNDARKVTNWWVDDEWDTVRSRGMRSTMRDIGTTSG